MSFLQAGFIEYFGYYRFFDNVSSHNRLRTKNYQVFGILNIYFTLIFNFNVPKLSKYIFFTKFSEENVKLAILLKKID